MLEVFLREKKVNLKIVGLFCVLLVVATMFFLLKQEKPALPENQPEGIEVFSLAGLITSVDSNNNSITVKHPAQDKDIKVILRHDSEIVRLELSDKDGIVEPKPVKISINDLKAGDQAFIESNENIYQKSEFDGIIRIQVLP